MTNITCNKCGRIFTSTMMFDVHLEELCNNTEGASKPREPRKCPVCGDTFIPRGGHHMICTAECRRQRELDKKAEKSLSFNRLCAWCGAAIGYQRFCSRKCRRALIAQQKAHKRDNPFLAKPEPLDGKPFRGYEHYLAQARRQGLSAGHIMANPNVAVPSQQRKRRDGQ